MDINQHITGSGLHTIGRSLRKYAHSLSARLQNGGLLAGWVILGLALIALLVAVLTEFPGDFGPILFGPKQTIVVMDALSTKALPAIPDVKLHIAGTSSLGGLFTIITPVAGTILLYLVLTFVQPGLFPWPRRRVAYLLTIGIIILAGSLLLPRVLPELITQFSFCIATYAIAAHARVTFRKRTGWLIEILVLLAVLLSLIVTSNQEYHKTLAMFDSITKATTYKSITVPPDDQWLLRIPLLGIQIGGTLQLFQAGLWLSGLICLHLFTGIGVRQRNAQQRSDALVEQLTQAQEQLRAYALHAEELATMRERVRIAREMHDTLAQGLAAMKMHLETGTTLFADHPDLSHQHIERARELAGAYLDETRNSILNLRADALDGRTLPAALASLASTWQTEQHQATFCVSGLAPDNPCWQTLPPALELACYRIAQEALSNASRHGQARHVEIELSIEEGREICLTITDDGLGFDPTAIRSEKPGGGFGIIGMHERLKLLKGRLEILSTPGAGTQVVAMLPLTSVDEAFSDRQFRSIGSGHTNRTNAFPGVEQ